MPDLQRVEATVTEAFKLSLLSTIIVLAGCGAVKSATPEVLPMGRYQIVSGQFRYFDQDSNSRTGSALLRIDTTTGETYQFLATDPHSLAGEWFKVK